jgi:DNA helicase-2/ATP-dependent DNA helicase PcrA
MEKQDLLSNLNDSQRQAVEYMDGPSLVIAGAGSGKTRVLTYKIAYLLQKGISPNHILALTFTNKVAKEMKERIAKLTGDKLVRYLAMGTFHSIFSHILRYEAPMIGYKSNFTIYDEADSRSLLKSIIKEMGLDEKNYKPAAVHSKISMAKNRLIDAAHYASNREFLNRDRDARQPEIDHIFTVYEERCKKANAMDFDDLLVLTFVLFRDHEDVRCKYAGRFQYVLVDEYQDTNYAQQQIVLQLTKQNQHVFVVGDDYQSIYAFRGANIDNILNFQKIYPNCRLFKLERNYRSTQNIVAAANSLMKHNVRQIPKDVYSENTTGDKVTLKSAYSDKEEAIIVCNDIKSIKALGHDDYSDFAILYRTNSQSRSFEEEMRKQSIPYRIFGGLSFYQRKEIKDIIAYFRLVANPADEEAFKRIINYPARGIGSTTVNKIADAARIHNVSFWNVILDPLSNVLTVNKGTIAKLNSFRNLISSYLEKISEKDVFQLGQEIIQTSGIFRDIYASKDPEAIARQENLEEFLNGMQDFVEERKEEGRETEIYLTDYLQDVALMSDLDSEGDADQSRVSLMTIHSAKGLEFPIVFVVGLEENIFPSPMSANSPRGLEEERRLLYVAITRAEKRCFLTCAKNRWRYGKMEFDTPSRFIQDIDPTLLNIQSSRMEYDDIYKSSDIESTRYRKEYGTHHSLKDGKYNYLGSNTKSGGAIIDTVPKASLKRVTFSDIDSGNTSVSETGATSDGGLVEGNIIEHQRFGIGSVVKVEGTGENTKATVDFKNAGRKQLLLKFARYVIVK